MQAPSCWCGEFATDPYSEAYTKCGRCGSLVSRASALPKQKVDNESEDLYGLNYFVEHARELGHPELQGRSRLDLSERCVFWLKALLRYRPPPARTLELGCANGAFVAMLSLAGYEATGLDLSPAVTSFVRETFDVPVLTGTLEDQGLAPQSMDVVIMMDVLEHLPGPKATLRAVADVLTPGGLLLVQTPRYDPSLGYEGLTDRNGAFLEQLKPEEHRFLFSEASVREILKGIGFDHLAFLPPIFSDYDMFLAASRKPLVEHSNGRDELRHARSGRLVDALIDSFESSRSFRPALTDHAILAAALSRLPPTSGGDRGVIARTLAALDELVSIGHRLGVTANSVDSAVDALVHARQEAENALVHARAEAEALARTSEEAKQQLQAALAELDWLAKVAAEHQTLRRRLGPLRRVFGAAHSTADRPPRRTLGT